MKKYTITFWIVTGLIVAFDSLIPALTFNTQLAIDGIKHLGFPDYFRYELTVFKVLGGIALIFPVPRSVKEWAYAGCAINFISAFVAHAVVDGWNMMAVMPLIILALLVVSYICYRKIAEAPGSASLISEKRRIVHMA